MLSVIALSANSGLELSSSSSIVKVFTLSDRMNIVAPESANGTKGFREWGVAFRGAAIRPPQSPSYYPAKSVVEWHVKEVFQGPERYKAPD
jgi:putative restriction endonuclease